jgi:soluble lytic murein transglycosylase-like protein
VPDLNLDLPEENTRSGMVLGTNRSRLAVAMEDTIVPEKPATFQSSEATVASGLANPFGGGIRAYEPSNVIFDQYKDAYNAVQQSKAEEEAKAQKYTDVLPLGAQGPANLTGVPYANLFAAAGAKYGVSPALLAAVARAESGFRPDARSPVGAQGLMQFMPATRGWASTRWTRRRRSTAPRAT